MATPLASARGTEDEAIMEKKDTRCDRAIDIDARSNKDDSPLESDLDGHEQPKELKEGGYGWYASSNASNWIRLDFEEAHMDF